MNSTAMTTMPATQPQADDDNHVSAVRRMLIEQIRAVRQAATPDALQIETTRSKSIAQLASAVTDIARVEADYAHKVSDKGTVGFLESRDNFHPVTTPAPGRTVHRLR